MGNNQNMTNNNQNMTDNTNSTMTNTNIGCNMTNMSFDQLHHLMTSPNMSSNVSFNNLQDLSSINDSNLETNLSPEHSDSCDMDAALDYSSPSLSAAGSPVSCNKGFSYGYSPSPESMKLTKGFSYDNNSMTNRTEITKDIFKALRGDSYEQYETKNTCSNTADTSTISTASPEPQLSSRDKFRLIGSLKWIIYSDHIDDYAEMLCTSESMRILTVNQCAKHSATHSACIKWAKRWNLVNHPKCADAVFGAMSAQSVGNKKPSVKKEAQVQGYHNLPECELEVEDVIFVNDASSFRQAKEVLLAETLCIGLDLECMVKRFSIPNAPKYCQTLQIATRAKTIIFDLQAIAGRHERVTRSSDGLDPVDPIECDELLYTLFYDASLIKVGMSFGSDIRCLGAQYPYFKAFKCIIKSYFELEDVLMFSRNEKGATLFGVDVEREALIKSTLSTTNTKKEGGLATVVRHVLKRRLNKNEQLSNWGNRPLRISQIEYAALDSAIEVEVFCEMQKRWPQLIAGQNWIGDLCRY